jgi:starch synthase
MRYGTVPIVRAVGGLRDTVVDIREPGGRGIRFDGFTLEEAAQAILIAHELYYQSAFLDEVRQRGMQADFSWERAATQYIDIYQLMI